MDITWRGPDLVSRLSRRWGSICQQTREEASGPSLACRAEQPAAGRVR